MSPYAGRQSTEKMTNRPHFGHILGRGTGKTMGNIPVTTTTKIFPKVLRYKWEACCNTNGRRTAIQMGRVLTVFPFPQSVGAPKALQYKLEAYCNTNGRRTVDTEIKVKLIPENILSLSLSHRY